MTDNYHETAMSLQDLRDERISAVENLCQGLLPRVNRLEPANLELTRIVFLDELRELSEGFHDRMNTRSFDVVVKRYKRISEAYDTIVYREESLDWGLQILMRARNTVLGEMGIEAEDEQTFADWKTLTDGFDAAYAMLREVKDDMRRHLFDHIYYFQQEHEEVDLGYEITFPRGYVTPPKVTTVGAMKVSAHD
ncbi:hypothetical protein SLS60_005204 [Paraconiothyrium brasiliense]|uniref:Uncharacterized protein n=1 Tax=Paraconiothyrium brasiliense TaxID=300254 RepID=A0ABR3RGR6_9PLEO